MLWLNLLSDELMLLPDLIRHPSGSREYSQIKVQAGLSDHRTSTGVGNLFRFALCSKLNFKHYQPLNKAWAKLNNCSIKSWVESC